MGNAGTSAAFTRASGRFSNSHALPLNPVRSHLASAVRQLRRRSPLAQGEIVSRPKRGLCRGRLQQRRQARHFGGSQPVPRPGLHAATAARGAGVRRGLPREQRRARPRRGWRRLDGPHRRLVHGQGGLLVQEPRGEGTRLRQALGETGVAGHGAGERDHVSARYTRRSPAGVRGGQLESEEPDDDLEAGEQRRQAHVRAARGRQCQRSRHGLWRHQRRWPRGHHVSLRLVRAARR